MAFIGLDKDGAWVNLLGTLFSTHNARHGTNFSHDDMTVYEIERRFDEKTARQLYDIMNAPGFFLSLEPYPGGVEDVRKLVASGHHVEVCTAPPLVWDEEGQFFRTNQHAAMEKILWIARRVPALARHVTLTQKKDRFAADALIDDHGKNIVAWCRRHPDGTGYLVDRPWNREYANLPENAVRCASFSEAVERAIRLPLEHDVGNFPEPPRPKP